MHTNGPDRWGVYVRPWGSDERWRLLPGFDFSTQTYARGCAQELNDVRSTLALLEFKAFVAYDGSSVREWIDA